jgi:hypothetical protein
MARLGAESYSGELVVRRRDGSEVLIAVWRRRGRDPDGALGWPSFQSAPVGILGAGGTGRTCSSECGSVEGVVEGFPRCPLGRKGASLGSVTQTPSARSGLQRHSGLARATKPPAKGAGHAAHNQSESRHYPK